MTAFPMCHWRVTRKKKKLRENTSERTLQETVPPRVSQRLTAGKVALGSAAWWRGECQGGNNSLIGFPKLATNGMSKSVPQYHSSLFVLCPAGGNTVMRLGLCKIHHSCLDAFSLGFNTNASWKIFPEFCACGSSSTGRQGAELAWLLVSRVGRFHVAKGSRCASGGRGHSGSIADPTMMRFTMVGSPKVSVLNKVAVPK